MNDMYIACAKCGYRFPDGDVAIACPICVATKAADAPKLMPYDLAAEVKKINDALDEVRAKFIKSNWVQYGYNIEEIQAAAKKYDVKYPKVTGTRVVAGEVKYVNVTFSNKPECDCYDRACHDGHAPWCATRSK